LNNVNYNGVIMKQFKSKLLVILAIFLYLNFKGMYVPPIVAPSTTNAVLEFISQNSDKIAEVGKGIILFFTSREIAKNLLKSEMKEKEALLLIF